MRIDKTQRKSKCRRCDNRDEMIKHIISECSKLSQKEYKTSHDWVGKVSHWELCKKFKFDNTKKWFWHNPASVLENDPHKLLRDWNTDGSSYLDQKTRPNNNRPKKENLQICELCCPCWPQNKTERLWKEGIRPC